MTKEEKATRYDIALDKIKRLLGSGSNCSREELEYVFPELKESEDEKIRNGLIGYFRAGKCENISSYHGISTNDILAWLEKQGKSDETKSKMFLINKGYPIDANGKFPTYEEMYDIIKKGLENQGEQPQGKSALEAIKEEKVDNQNCIKSYTQEHIGDAIEPKFKVGDWVIIDGETLHIVNVTEDEYLTEEGGHIPFRCEKDARLWNINDAKEGDILVCGNDIVIFKENNYNPKDQSGCMFVYCSCNNFREIGGINPTSYKPSTKEQCDPLFKRMKAAGYTFDFEKKELKKIEQNPAKEYSFNIKSELFHQLTKEQQGLWRKEIEQAYNVGANTLKPSEWSKEDESIALGVEQLCNCASLLNIAPDKIDKIRTWLKHLKDRVQPQRESGERNKLLGKLEEWLDEYVSDLADVDTATLIGSFTNYLDGKLPKSIRPQKQWKPTEEQIDIIDMILTDEAMDDNVKSILKELKEQLKQL